MSVPGPQGRRSDGRAIDVLSEPDDESGGEQADERGDAQDGGLLSCLGVGQNRAVVWPPGRRPADLATNRAQMEGFGLDNAQLRLLKRREEVKRFVLDTGPMVALLRTVTSIRFSERVLPPWSRVPSSGSSRGRPPRGRRRGGGAASVLLLVPGVAAINAIEDVLKGYPVVGLARSLGAILTIVAAAVGLVLAMRLTGPPS